MTRAGRIGIVTGTGLVVVAMVFAGASCIQRGGRTDQSKSSDRERVEQSVRLDRAISSAADYLVRHCDEHGRFTYRVWLDPSVEADDEYNVIRHAGTIYALAAAHRRSPSPEKLEALRRAAAFLRRETLGPVLDHPDMLAVYSPPDVEETDQPLQAKLGGAGLGLVALLSVEQIEPGSVPLEELRALGRFILFMQKPDGSFFADYYPDAWGRDPDSASLYYPGEAALGLLMLHEKDPQSDWLHGAARAIAYLARSRRGATEVEADHWALLATSRLWPLRDECDPPLPAETLQRHAVQICRQILATRDAISGPVRETGCLTADGRTCPTATRVEGLAAALTFLSDEDATLCDDIRRTIGRATGFLIDSQIRQGPHAGGIPGSIELDPESVATPDRVSPSDEIRIDYVQHALSALIQWEELVGSEDPGENRAVGAAKNE